MRLRPGPVAALLVLLGLGTWVYYSEFRGAAGKEKAEKDKDRVFAFERADLKAVVLRNPAGTLRLQKEGDAWAIKEPIETAADRDAVEGLLTSLEVARVERRLGTDGDRKTFGLDPAPLGITLETGAGAPVGVALGDTNPIGGAYYATLPGGEMALVGAALGDVAKRDLLGLRDKALLSFDPWKTKSLTIERGAETIALEKKEAGWVLTRPIGAPADGPTITDLLNALERLRAAAFVTEHAAPADLRALGFEPPAARMSVLQEGWDTAKTVEFGGEKDGRRNARTIGRDAVVAIGPDFWPKATTALFDLRRRDALGLSQYRLKSISVARDGGKALVLEKGKEGTWNVSGAATGMVPYDPVDALVRMFADIKAVAFDDRPAPALVEALAKNPAIDATFEQEPDTEGGTAPRQHLLIGAAGTNNRMPVRDPDWTFVLWADGTAVAKIRGQVDAIIAQAATPPPAPAAPAGDGAAPPPGGAPAD